MQDFSLVTNELLEVLRTAPGDGMPDERRVGDHGGPDDLTLPYAVLRIVDVIEGEGSWGDPHEMPELVVQVTSVGGTREQAQLHSWWMAQLILGRGPDGYLHAIAGDGWRAWRRGYETGAGVEGGTVEDPLFNAVDRFRLAFAKA